jgi:transcriptional regulator with XRE-family HTH domain
MSDKVTELTEYQAATNNLKRALKQRGLTYHQLAHGIGLSESGVKKIFLAKDGSFQRLAQICRHVGISISEIVEDNSSREVEFSQRQQQEFLKAPRLFHLYWLLVYERRSISDSQQALRLNKSECFSLMRKLDNLDLIKLLPGDRIRVPSIKAVSWSGDNEFVRKLYRDWSRDLVDSLRMNTQQPNEFFLLRYLQMTSQTYTEFREALRNLEVEFVRRAIHEMRTQPSRVGHVRWLVAADKLSFVTGDELKSPTN